MGRLTRRRRVLPLVLAVVATGALAVVAARPAEAWNPLQPLADAARAIGRGIGHGLGGLVESATTPTIRNAQDAGRRLIADVEVSLGRQLDHAGAVATTLVGTVDRAVATTLEQVDRSLGARITQVHLAGDELVDRGFDRIDRSIGLLDDVARRRIAQLERTGTRLIDTAGKQAAALLAQLDASLEARVGDVEQLVSSSLEQADQMAEARIAQVDELAGRRIGSLDVIATKQSLGLEAMLLRLAALIGMVAFVGFVLWRLFVEAAASWKQALATRIPRRILETLLGGAPRFLVQVALGVAGIGALYLLAGYLPRDAVARTRLQIEEHEAALTAAFAAYDFTAVRYHSTQLELLKPADAPRYHAQARKAELLRTVFGRPALLQSIAGVRQIAAEATAVERALGAPDADVLTLEGFVTWQVGETRRDEYDAAVLCARALRTAPDFMLEVLARNYLRAFFREPYTVDAEVTQAALDDLRRALPDEPEPDDHPQFQHVLAYNALVSRLDRDSTAAYLDMLDAQVEYALARGTTRLESADARAARERRNQHAGRVVAAWQAFDAELRASPWLADDPTVLAVFTLDDSILTRALYFTVVPTATRPSAAPATLPPLVRLQLAPIRVAWATRYATLLGPTAADVLAIEESARFARFERRAIAFEQAYLALATALRASPRPDAGRLTELATRALPAAAAIGFLRDTPGGRRSVAALLAAALREAGGAVSPALEQELAAQAQQRRLRLL